MAETKCIRIHIREKNVLETNTFLQNIYGAGGLFLISTSRSRFFLFFILFYFFFIIIIIIYPYFETILFCNPIAATLYINRG